MLNNSKIPQQVISLAILFSTLIAVFFIARALFVPESFGDLGHYRADAVGEIKAQEIHYAGYEICMDCHDDIFELKAESNHSGLACEVCHGPAAQHVDAPDEFIPSAPRERGFCPLCHGFNPSRPTGFPQIITEYHNPGSACMTCHDPHSPALPHEDGECSACHREITSQKMVSHHTSVDCEKCHIVSQEHAANPRFGTAEIPTRKETCGQCHARDAKSSKLIPRVDIDTHGERYLCWDCHYPHHPEAAK